MIAPVEHSITFGQDERFIIGPFGCLIPRFPPSRAYVYLIHFKTRYHHAGHYCGFTTNLEARLTCHRAGNGARLMEVVTEAGIEWELVRLWPVATSEEGHALERKIKNQHGSGPQCPICNPRRGSDLLVMLRQGKRPFDRLARPGKRQPMNERRPMFIHR